MSGVEPVQHGPDRPRVWPLDLQQQAQSDIRQSVSLVLIGPGKVGTAFLNQLTEWQSADTDRAEQISLLALCRQRTMLTEARGISLEDWQHRLDTSNQASNLDHLSLFLSQLRHRRIVIIDSTASSEVAAYHVQWLNAGHDVITANKAGPAGSQNRWDRARPDSAVNAQPHYGIETTVGAALPVIDTLIKLKHAGDSVIRIDGIFSGSIAWIFNQVDNGIRLSDAIVEAHRLGLTEPDPRDDLSGLDIARKLLILARQTGWREELDRVDVPDLLPFPLKACSLDEFFTRLNEVDDHLSGAIDDARDSGRKLLVEGCIDSSSGLAARLSSHPRDHAFSLANASDNIIRIFTRRYGEHPLIIQGAGAGVELTASGLITELVQLLQG